MERYVLPSHRFPIGTKYKQSYSRAGFRICTVTDQMTVTNSKGEVVRRYYVATHEAMGQVITDHNVVDATIARNIIKE